MTELGAERRERVDSLVFDWLQANDVPGVSVVLVDADGELYGEGFGARDLASNAPATPDTLYAVGSISKTVTALAVGQLVEDDKLAFEDPVDDHVDHLADAPGDPITVAELLSHTSGMPASGPAFLAQAFAGRPAGVADDADHERAVRDATDWRVVGDDRFMYYNGGYEVLGKVVEAVDGRPFATYVEEAVLDPLGMTRSTYDADALDADDDAMTGYEPGEDGAVEPADFPEFSFIQPSGGLLASPRELSRLLRAAMNDGALFGERVCSPSTLETLQEPRAVRQAFLDGTEETYGYGWMRQPIGDDVALGHGGSILVATAYAGYLEDAEVGVAVACNTTAEPHPADLGLAVLAVATGREPTAFPAFGLDAKLDAVTGRYAGPRGGPTATVERAAGGLRVDLDGDLYDDTVHALPRSADPEDYRFDTVNAAGGTPTLTFDLDGDTDDLRYTRLRLKRTGDPT